MKTPPDPRFTALHTALRAVGEPTRLRILGLLAAGEVCVCHIHEALGIPQPTASRHLASLRRAGLVETRRDGLWVHYRLSSAQDGAVRAIIATVAHCIGHAKTIARDRERLRRTTGCCVVDAPPSAHLACCGPAKGVQETSIQPAARS